MLRLEEVLQLKEKEEIRLVAKRHGITLVPGLTLAFLFIVIPFFFLFPLFSMGIVGAVAFLMIVLAGLILAWRAFAIWDGDALIVSTHRLVKVHQAGIFSRTVSEIPLASILEVSWSKKGIGGHLFNTGTVRILAGQEMVVNHIPRPQALHALIMELMERVKQKGAFEDNHLREHRLAKLIKTLEGMDDQSLREIERLLGRGHHSESSQGTLFQDIKPISPNVVHAIPDMPYEQPVMHDSPGDSHDSEIHIKTLFGEDRTTRLKLMDE